MGIVHAEGTDPTASLDPDLARAARGIGMAVAIRLRDLAPAIRPALPGGDEPTFLIEAMDLDPPDPADPVTLVACLEAHDAYVAGRGRPGAASPGALALARVLVWAARAEVLGRAPRIAWIGPPSRRPDGAEGHAVTADVRLRGEEGPARASALLLVA